MLIKFKAYDDWCVSQMAKALGYNDDYEYFKLRANYYKNIFNQDLRFMWMKNEETSVESDPPAETFIMSANIEEYTIAPYKNNEGKSLATIKAYIRT